MSVFIIAEIGINHNGDIEIAKRLIDMAKGAGCIAVKFQKRAIDVVYTSPGFASPRTCGAKHKSSAISLTKAVNSETPETREMAGIPLWRLESSSLSPGYC